MGDDDRVSGELDERLTEVTEDMWTRRETDAAVDEVAHGDAITNEVVLTDEDIAEEADTSLPVVRAWLDAEDGKGLVVEQDGETRSVQALLDE